MRLVYFGSPEMAVAPLKALILAGHDICLVVSNPDRRRSRRGQPEPTPVKAAALEAGLEVTDDPESVLGVEADLGVVVAYGQIIRPNLLAHLNMVNLHFSLLPRWRGAAPVERAILEGDKTTGVCVMEVAEGLDTGSVYSIVEVDIPPTATAEELRVDLVTAGSQLLVETLNEGLPAPEPQSPDGITYAKKISPAEMKVEVSDSADLALRKIRVGGAWSTFRGKRLKLLQAGMPHDGSTPLPDAEAGIIHLDPSVLGAVGFSDGALVVSQVQPEGKRPMAFSDWANGAQINPGELLGS